MKNFRLLLTLIFLGIFLRFFYLGEKSIWLDEACSLYEAKKEIPHLIKEAFSYDLHPPLYSIVLHYWIKIGGGEFILRSLSAIFGFLSLIAFYKLAGLILKREGSLVALSLFAFSSLAIFFSQEARPYSLFLFEAILLSYLFLKALSSMSRRYLLFYVLIGITSIYTHIYTALIFLSHLVYLVLFKREDRKKICEFIFAIFIIGLFFLPWLPAVTSKACLFKGEWKGGIFLSGMREVLTKFNFYPDINPLLAIILACVFILVIALTAIREKGMREEIYFSVTSFLLPLLIILLYPFRIHQFRVKEVIFICPFWYIILTWSVLRLRSFYKGIILAVWLLVNTFVLSTYYSPDFVKEDWRGVARCIECEESEGEAIIFNPPYLGFPFDYYYKGRLPRGKLETIKESEFLMKRYNSIWLIESSSYLAQPLNAPRLLIEPLFEKRKKTVRRGYSGDIVITKFY